MKIDLDLININIKNKNKILILGIPGSGKSTLAKKVSKITGISLFHLDKYYWLDGWQKQTEDKWNSINQEILSYDKWIIDGNYIDTLDKRLRDCDLVIFLKMNRFRALYRVIKRIIVNKKRTRTDISENCIEKITPCFFKYIWNFNKNDIHSILNKIKAHNINVIYL